MERFRFGLKERGCNGKLLTVNGFVAVISEAERCTLEIAGPNGGVRALVVMDKATAGKLGAALMKWAGADDDIIGVYSKKTGKITPWAEL
jgi:hypothetical protein